MKNTVITKKGAIKTAVYPIIFVFGGFLYGLIEILWRGRTHLSMLLTGGFCSCILYRLTALNKPIRKCCVYSSCMITLLEFVVGCFVNLLLKLDVWDYSRCKFNILGQICPLYSFFWLILSIPVLFLLKALRKHIEKNK